MMRLFAIKQGYIVKSVVFLSFLGIISLGAIGGCSDDNNSINATALTENDFAQDSSLRADLEGVVVTFLESPESEASENDTGAAGIDLVPITVRQRIKQKFCWEVDDADAMIFMELRDSEESLILSLQVNDDCVTEELDAGNYEISIHRDESSGDTLPVFLIPQVEESEQAGKPDGLFNRVYIEVAGIFNAIQKSVTKDARAQTVEENRSTLITTNSCFNCNLEGAFLVGAQLRKADLSLARMVEAILLEADLSSAELVVANLRRAVLFGADLSDANLSGAFLNGANLVSADLIGAILSGADLSGADLTNADLSGAIMNGVILRNTNFSGATWCDGSCLCAERSFGSCNGCASVDICTGP